jgi:hypothetical protein
VPPGSPVRSDAAAPGHHPAPQLVVHQPDGVGHGLLLLRPRVRLLQRDAAAARLGPGTDSTKLLFARKPYG